MSTSTTPAAKAAMTRVRTLAKEYRDARDAAALYVEARDAAEDRLVAAMARAYEANPDVSLTVLADEYGKSRTTVQAKLQRLGVRLRAGTGGRPRKQAS